jgi:hypothetical protein
MNDQARSKKSWRLGFLLIYPRFQLQLVAVNALIMLLSFAFVWLQTARSFNSLSDMGVQAGLPPDHAYFQFLVFQAKYLYSHLAVALGAGLALSSVCILIISSKLAGPVLRLKGYFTSILPGRKPMHQLTFRQGDFFTELPPVINAALERMTAPVSEELPLEPAEDETDRESA